MGEVYRAKDTRLDRTVAIKVLPAHLAADSERRQRFEREARAVSSLNHPHICALYDIGKRDGIDFLVMEYLEGETLAARLTKGPLPPDQVLRHAIEIADALAQAHRQGVSHRDLKPANMMLTRSGVKLLDFGLAKLREGARGAAGGLSALATEGLDLTQKGTILGTLQYGAVLYEMVAGRKAFSGESQASVIAAILERDPPPLSAMQPDSPPGSSLQWVVTRCLAKDPDDRWQTARDLLAELQRLMQARGTQTGISAPSKTRERLGWIVAGLLLLILLVIGVSRWQQAPAKSEVARFSIYPPEKTTFTSAVAVATVASAELDLSPDGRHLVFVASAAGSPPLLWLRPLDDTSARPLPGTEGASYPFWSADSRAIGFFAQGKIKKIDLGNSFVQILSEAASRDPRGCTWNAEDVILCAPTAGGLYRVPAGGGRTTAVTTPEASRGESSHRWPYFLPDGRHFLYHVRSKLAEHRGIYVGSLDGKVAKRLVPSELVGGAYAWSGHLLFLNGTTLMAQAFDIDKLQLTGQPFPIGQQVGASTTGYPAFSFSRDGVLAYGSSVRPLSRLRWFDRKGVALETIERPGDYADFRISPDGKRIAWSQIDPATNTPDIWLHDLSRGATSRFTFDPGVDASAQWSPDGSRIIFRANRGGLPQLYQRLSSGGGTEELLFDEARQRTVHGQPVIPVPTDWSSDGRFIVYSAAAKLAGFDLWVLPLSGDRKPFPLVESPFYEMHPSFSPNVRWVAYDSDESGRFEVYVQAFGGPAGAPSSGDKWNVSTNGGTEPRWRADGKELYYVAPDRRLMAVSVKTEGSFEAGVPRALFQTRMPDVINTNRQHYVPTADGQRFLINTLLEENTVRPITVVLNWTAGLKK